MSKRKHRKKQQQNEPTFPSFSLKQNEAELGYSKEGRHHKRENFDSDDPLISGFGGHYGHESELEIDKSRSPKGNTPKKQNVIRKANSKK